MPKDQLELAQERTDLAVERTIFAAERTLLSYWRTGLAFGGAGAVIIKFFSQPIVIAGGGAFIIVGIGLLVYGTAQFIVFRKRIIKPGTVKNTQ